MTTQSALLLQKQLKELKKNPVNGFSAGLIDDNDIYKWEVKKRFFILIYFTNSS
jgi:ubiquitin-conjugating enzyme E2 G1